MARSVNKKICMLGDFAVGKTSLVRRYVLSQFSTDYHSTLGVNMLKFTDAMAGPDGPVPMDMILWDIEGGIQSDTMLRSYMMGAAGAVVVSDATRPETVSQMRDYADRFRSALPGRPLCFALNKMDLVEGQPACGADADAVAEAFDGELLHTSAATGDSVPALFRALGERILRIGA